MLAFVGVKYSGWGGFAPRHVWEVPVCWECAVRSLIKLLPFNSVPGAAQLRPTCAKPQTLLRINEFMDRECVGAALMQHNHARRYYGLAAEMKNCCGVHLDGGGEGS